MFQIVLDDAEVADAAARLPSCDPPPPPKRKEKENTFLKKFILISIVLFAVVCNIHRFRNICSSYLHLVHVNICDATHGQFLYNSNCKKVQQPHFSLKEIVTKINSYAYH